jgi:hypothetical protein
MQISKTVTVTIETDLDDVTKCNLTCSQAEECRFCRRYGDDGIDGIGGYEFSHNDDKRHPLCLAEFGTGEKPAVVPWEESKVGDVVEIKGQHYVINYGESAWDACEKCCLYDIPYCKGETEDSWCCYDHPSGFDVYFTEVENSPK